MMTKAKIAEALEGINVVDLSKLSGVSVKTIYRYRSGTKHDPRLGTVSRLLEAAKRLPKRAAKAA